MKGRGVLYLPILLFLTLASGAYGANVLVPNMSLTTFFDQDAELQTYGRFDLSFNGGYKYQAKVAFQYLNPTLETDNTPAIIFDGAQASIRRIFGVMDITYWTGYYGVIGEGDYYIGYTYHRVDGFEYRGYFPLLGTGGIVGLRSKNDRVGAKVYTYQWYGVEYLNSFDLEFNLNTDPLLFNTFVGKSDREWRAGLQFKYLGEAVGFYLTVGHLTLTTGNLLNFDELYFLLEQRLSVGNWNFIPSIFARPKYHYNHLTRSYLPTNEVNDIDFNFNLFYEPQTKKFALGGELNLQTNRVEEFGVYISPYVRFHTFGVNWQVKTDFNVLTEARPFFTGYIDINASF
jgi:hypothetical protein